MDISRRGALGLAGMAGAALPARAITIAPKPADPAGFAPAPGVAHLKSVSYTHLTLPTILRV